MVSVPLLTVHAGAKLFSERNTFSKGFRSGVYTSLIMAVTNQEIMTFLKCNVQLINTTTKNIDYFFTLVTFVSYAKE